MKLAPRIAVDDKGNYWLDYLDHYSMPPVSEDNDPIEVIAYYVRLQGKPLTFLSRLLHGFGARDRIPAHRCCGRRWRDLPSHRQFVHGEQLATVPCHCGAPATHWVYQVMSDGQTIDGEARCQSHMDPQT